MSAALAGVKAQTFSKPSEGYARERAEMRAAFRRGQEIQRLANLRAEAAIQLEHVGGVAWYDMPKPRRWHRCKVQTSGFIAETLVERCACGAIRSSMRGGWIQRNSR